MFSYQQEVFTVKCWQSIGSLIIFVAASHSQSVRQMLGQRAPDFVHNDAYASFSNISARGVSFLINNIAYLLMVSVFRSYIWVFL